MAIDNKFIADALFPTFPVKTRTGNYVRIKRGKGQLLANAAGDGKKDPLARAPGTPYAEFTRTSEKASWNTVDRGMKTPVDDVNAQDLARFFDQESADAKWLMRMIRMYREARVAAFINNEARWGFIESDLAFTAANLATFDAPGLIREAKRMVDKRQEDCNTLAMSRELWDLISLSDKMVKYCFGALQGQSAVTEKVVAEKFGFAQVLIGNASYDTSKPGKDGSDDTLVWCWGDTYIFVGSVQGGAPENGGIGRTFVLEDLTSGGMLYVPETYRDEDKRSNILRVRQDSEENTVNELAGLLIKVNDLE